MPKAQFCRSVIASVLYSVCVCVLLLSEMPWKRSTILAVAAAQRGTGRQGRGRLDHYPQEDVEEAERLDLYPQEDVEEAVAPRGARAAVASSALHSSYLNRRGGGRGRGWQA